MLSFPDEKTTLAVSETNELVDYFPVRFKEKGKLLVALFLSAELKELGVVMNQRDLVHEEIAKLVSPSTQSYLSDLGMREFNKYVYGGFNVLLDWFDDRPRSLEAFLIQFKRELDQSLQGE